MLVNTMDGKQYMKNIGHGTDWFRRKWLEYQVTERIWGFTIMELLVIVVIILLVTI
jgi:hypothetical protein